MSYCFVFNYVDLLLPTWVHVGASGHMGPMSSGVGPDPGPGPQDPGPGTGPQEAVVLRICARFLTWGGAPGGLV